MDHKKQWQQSLKNNSSTENAIAVVGFKAALLVGKIYYEILHNTGLILKEFR